MKWYIKVLKNYAVFSGRASRTEYWMSLLFNIIVSSLVAVIAVILSTVTKTNQMVLLDIYSLAMLIPSFSVGCRRMHDTDRSGWWLVVPVVSLIFLVGEGTKGDNKFGSDPWSS